MSKVHSTKPAKYDRVRLVYDYELLREHIYQNFINDLLLIAFVGKGFSK